MWMLTGGGIRSPRRREQLYRWFANDVGAASRAPGPGQRALLGADVPVDDAPAGVRAVVGVVELVTLIVGWWPFGWRQRVGGGHAGDGVVDAQVRTADLRRR